MRDPILHALLCLQTGKSSFIRRLLEVADLCDAGGSIDARAAIAMIVGAQFGGMRLMCTGLRMNLALGDLHACATNYLLQLFVAEFLHHVLVVH